MDKKVFEKLTKKLVKEYFYASDKDGINCVKQIPRVKQCQCGQTNKDVQVITFTKRVTTQDETYWRKKCWSCKRGQNIYSTNLDEMAFKTDFVIENRYR